MGVGATEATPDSTWQRDYRVSLVLLAAGILILAGVAAYDLWSYSTGNHPTSYWAGLSLVAIGSVGFGLLIFSGTVAYYHRAGLKLLTRQT